MVKKKPGVDPGFAGQEVALQNFRFIQQVRMLAVLVLKPKEREAFVTKLAMWQESTGKPVDDPRLVMEMFVEAVRGGPS